MKKGILILILFIFWATPPLVHAQGGNSKMVKISGMVSDAQGLPIHKVQVFVDSLITGIRTNKKGEYKLRIPEDTNLVGVYSEMYGMQNKVYNGEKEIDFKFSAKTEVFSKSELSNMGYIFDAQVFRNIGKKNFSDYANVYQIIREKFTGVIVNGSTITVRGYTGGDQTPLFIVDGSPVSSIDSVNPDEIKSIELLKKEDASLYGSRGAPGVIIITLK